MLEAVIVITTLLCGLVSGLLFAFAVVAMPGIRNLEDGAFIRAFQVMDGVIQDNQPLFIVAWLGSVLGLLIATIIGFGQLEGLDRVLLVVAALVYIVGVQVPTATVNIPLNNALQRVDVGSSGGTELAASREAFEGRWNRWNNVRTILAIAATTTLLVVLLRI